MDEKGDCELLGRMGELIYEQNDSWDCQVLVGGNENRESAKIGWKLQFYLATKNCHTKTRENCEMV